MKYDFLTVEETALILKVNKMTIYRYIKAGRLAAYKTGKNFRISKEDFNMFLDKIKVSNYDKTK